MSVLQQLYRHNRWANLTLLDFCSGLNPEQLDTRAPGAFQGAYGSLVHLLFNEEGYYQGITGITLDRPPWNPENLPSPQDVRRRMEDIAGRYIALCDELTEDRIFEAEFQGQKYRMPAYIPFFQCINHSTEHREQAKAGLTLAGLEPPTIDLWTWETAGRP